MTRIENWMVMSSSRFSTPDKSRTSLSVTGRVYGHPWRQDGELVTTSPIASAKGRVIETMSGSLYRLGVAADRYLAFLREQVPDWNPEHPIRMWVDDTSRELVN